jgi:hypothetical protein
MTRLVVLAAAGAALLVASASGATTQPRLAGTWNVTGSYVLVENLRDRKVGDRFAERWRFTPKCRTGACNATLRRFGRTIAMKRRGRTWTGTERFTGQFFCGDRVYANGTDYVAQWSVTVTRSAVRSGGRVATRLTGVGATVGRSRAIPCAPTPVVSREGVRFTAVPAR